MMGGNRSFPLQRCVWQSPDFPARIMLYGLFSLFCHKRWNGYEQFSKDGDKAVVCTTARL